jgi:YHS domain-containing protein
MRRNNRAVLAALLLVVAAGSAAGADDPKSGRRRDQEALKPFGGLVGSWRGTGQPERGRTKGAWLEKASWAWKLTSDSAALEVTVDKGKYLKSAVLSPGKDAKSYVLVATLADGSSRTFKGSDAGKKALVLTAAEQGTGVRRITITPLHDTRLLVKLEAQDPAGKLYHQLGEVGYTREGISFAAGESGPVCIVTEGRGTLSVTYKGKTYHVCCSGCRDLFNDNPEAVLAEAAEREKAKAKK